MSHDDPDLAKVYNDGERLVPGETHDRLEVIRHKSSYDFFGQVIQADIKSDPSMLNRSIKILDIGSGTGHGTFMLAGLIGVEVTGVEPGTDAFAYSVKNYSRHNLRYINLDLASFIRQNQVEFDYVVSRHALEHVIDGLNMALQIPAIKRRLVNVPYNESDINPHHLVHWIKEEHFQNYPNREFFYEDLDGVTLSACDSEKPPNSIVCISSATGMRPVASFMNFPLSAWQPEFLQNLGLGVLDRNDAISREEALQAALRETSLQSREIEILTRKDQLDEQEAKLVAAQAMLQKSQDQLYQRKAELDHLEAGLVARQEALKQQSAELAARTAEHDRVARNQLEELSGDRAKFATDVEKFESSVSVRVWRKISSSKR